MSLRPAKGPKGAQNLSNLMRGKTASPEKEGEIHFCSVLCIYKR